MRFCELLLLLFINFRLSRSFVMVLGGNGYVGSAITKCLNKAGCSVVTVGRSSTGTSTSPLTTHVECDLTKQTPNLSNLLSTTPHSPSDLTCVVHAIGCLLDTQSGLGNLNKLASGTKRDPSGTYDDVTLGTARNAIDMISASKSVDGAECPCDKFVFVSAAEAGWNEDNGGAIVESLLAPEWLKRYLSAKRSAEELVRDSCMGGYVIRPSIVYSEGDLGSLGVRVGFGLGTKVGLKFVEEPIEVGVVGDGARIMAMEDGIREGIWGGDDVKRLVKERG